MVERLKALSVKQPWASLILNGYKPLEIRTWQTDYRGRLLIHTGKNVDADAKAHFSAFISLHDLQWHDVTGCILGYATLLDIFEIRSRDTWNFYMDEHLCWWSFPDYSRGVKWTSNRTFGWVFSLPKFLQEPVPYKGRLKLFDVLADVEVENDNQI